MDEKILRVKNDTQHSLSSPDDGDIYEVVVQINEGTPFTIAHIPKGQSFNLQIKAEPRFNNNFVMKDKEGNMASIEMRPVKKTDKKDEAN